jgi:hypothetical protein
VVAFSSSCYLGRVVSYSPQFSTKQMTRMHGPDKIGISVTYHIVELSGPCRFPVRGRMQVADGFTIFHLSILEEHAHMKV